MSTKPKKTTWQVTTLTPVHIGSGYEMQIDMDYYPDRQSLHVIDLDDLLQGLEGNEAALREFGRDGFRLSNFMRSYHLKAEGGYHLPLGGGRPPRSVRQFVKDGFGRAYVPGSTVKGALRTALWVNTLDRSRLPRVGRTSHDFFDFKREVSNVSGRDPNHDFLRPLKVGDGSALSCKGHLKADEVKFFNIRFGNRPGWKDFGSHGRPTKPKFREAQGLVVETMAENVDFFMQLSMENFLLQKDIKSVAGLPRCTALSSIAEFCYIMNKHAYTIIMGEQEFFSQFETDTSFVVESYDKLLSKVMETGKTENSFVLRMAWGSGWTGMTGGWIDPADMASIRQNARPRLGRENMPFPKTRRLIMRDGCPSIPPGWLLFHQVDEDRYLSAALKDSSASSCVRGVGSNDGVSDKIMPSPEIPVVQPPPPGEIREEQLNEFLDYLNAIPQLPPVIDSLITRIEAKEDPELQKEMSQAVLNKAKAMGNSFKKAKKSNKAWVLKIEDFVSRFVQ